MTTSTSRRRRGILQNFANQLAQHAVGWKIIDDSEVILAQPETGVIEFDVASGTTVMNGKDIESVTGGRMHRWALDELVRRGLDRSWLLTATISMTYHWRVDQKSASIEATARASVTSADGEASSVATNYQALSLPPRA